MRKPDLASKIAGLLGAPVKHTVVHALDRVDLTVAPGEVVGLVGESGSGKSTLGRIVAGLQDASDGEVLFEGKDRRTLDADARKRAYLAVQMVFQDPMSSLNPRLRIADIIGEAPLFHGVIDRAGLRRLRLGDDEHGRPEPGLCRALSASVLRRPARAHRHCAGAGGEAAHAGLRMRRSRRWMRRSRRRSSTCS